MDKRYPYYPLPDFYTFKKNASSPADIAPQNRPPMDDTRKMHYDSTLEEALPKRKK